MSQQQSAVCERQDTHTEEPRSYGVWLLNDDFTPMDFVVEILCTIFDKAPGIAENITMRVHRSGRAVAGIYSFDIAHSKAEKAMRRAREEQFPLRLEVTED